jgi:hypothetical protein
MRKSRSNGQSHKSHAPARALALFLVLLSALSSAALSGCAPGKEVNMWFEHSTKKILREYTDPDGRAEYRLCLAKNEYEGCQVAVNFPVRREALTVSLSAAEAEGVTAEVYREHFLPVTMSSPFLAVDSSEEGRYREYPDAIYPHTEPFSLAPWTTEPLYILVHASKDAKAGDHKFTVLVKDGEETVSEGVLYVHVWDFALGDAPAMAAVSDLSAGSIAAKSGAEGEEVQRLYNKYYDFLVEHHVSPYSLPYDVLDERADEYMSDPRVTGFRVNYGSDDYLRAVGEKLSSNPEWMKKAYFYFLDEPSNEYSYMDLVSKCAHLLEIIPEARIVSPFFVDPDMYTGEDAVEYCFGSVNIWCAKLFCFDSDNIYSEAQRKRLAPLRDRLLDRRKLGEEVWTYVCWEPGEPYLNLYVNMEGILHRLIFWQNYLLGANGFLYWSSNYWSGIKDPWTDMATVNWLSSYVYGDGSLIYNGNKVGVDGACSSLRLELVRDGIDDYTYMSMLEERGVGREAIVNVVSKLTPSLTEYTRDDDLLYKVRIMLGEMLESTSR